MSKFIDLSNQTFNYWKVQYLVSKGTNCDSIWHCQCLLCGKEKDIRAYSLTKGISTKCRACATHQLKIKPFSKDPIKIVFKGMKQRCYNPKTTYYKNYGAKGITICDKWLNNPILFYEWAYQNGYKKGMSIERKNVNEGYNPNNCCFIPLVEQSKNRSISHMFTINGITKCLADWCKDYNINYTTVVARIKKGMPYEKALSLPIQKQKNL